jgi:hypothetical protein
LSAEWPLPKPAAADAAEPLLPLVFSEHVELIRSGRAVDAFARRRAGQMVSHGHTAESDLDKPPAYLAKQAKDRLHAFLDFMDPQRMNLPPERRAQLLRYVDTAGAMLIALRERIETEVPDE